MAISPNFNEQEAAKILRIYENAEIEILKKITDRLRKGMDEPEWAKKKLTEVHALRQELLKIFGKLNEDVPDTMSELLKEVYQAGIDSADHDLKVVSQIPIDGSNVTITTSDTVTASFGTINNRSIETLTKEIIGGVQATHVHALRNAQDVYHNVLSEVLGLGLTGVDTRRQVSQVALNKFANSGVTGFVDKAGRQWELASYAEMATRAGLARASINGHVNRMQEQGRDLAIVSDHPEECELCRPYERKILSVSGNDPNYTSLSEAEVNGLFHPSCGHRLNTYIAGLTEIDTPEGDPKGYEKRQQQRYLERGVRQWKRREAVALDDDEAKKAKQKRLEWQQRMKGFIDQTDRRRKYERESTTRAR